MANYQNKSEYSVMNKNRPVFPFLCSRNKFDKASIQELFWSAPSDIGP